MRQSKFNLDTSATGDWESANLHQAQRGQRVKETCEEGCEELEPTSDNPHGSWTVCARANSTQPHRGCDIHNPATSCSFEFLSQHKINVVKVGLQHAQADGKPAVVGAQTSFKQLNRLQWRFIAYRLRNLNVYLEHRCLRGIHV